MIVSCSSVVLRSATWKGGCADAVRAEREKAREQNHSNRQGFREIIEPPPDEGKRVIRAYTRSRAGGEGPQPASDPISSPGRTGWYAPAVAPYEGAEMRRDTAPGWALPLLIVLSLAGAGIGLMLTSYHLSGGRAPWKLFQTVCGADGGGCAEVLSSRWAVLPGGIPLAALGVIYFGGLGLWYLTVGLANRRGRFWQALPFAVQIAGVLASAYYLGVMLTKVYVVCWWCLLSHLINFVLLFVAWKAWPRDDGYSNEPAQPSPRLGFAGILLVIALAALTVQRIIVVQVRSLTEQANQYAQTFYNDLDLQRYLHLRQAPRPLDLRPDDPVRGTPTAPHTVVVFSDFQCPGCRSFA